LSASSSVQPALNNRIQIDKAIRKIMNKCPNIIRLTSLVAVVSLALSSSNLVYSKPLAKAERVEQTILTDAQKSQIKINSSVERTQQLRLEVDQLRQEIADLTTYQNHLDTLIESQVQMIHSIDHQLDQIAETRQGIVPLMYDMLDGLSAYVAQGVPIRLDERLERISKLQQMMGQAHITDAERFRRILEAYQIELDYVSQLGSYVGTIEVDGLTRSAELLYLGQLSFIARSLDKQHYWRWDQSTTRWRILAHSVNADLNQAFLLASKSIPPALLRLPLSIQAVSR
jgi:regulator of replication initiation timing